MDSPSSNESEGSELRAHVNQSVGSNILPRPPMGPEYPPPRQKPNNWPYQSRDALDPRMFLTRTLSQEQSPSAKPDPLPPLPNINNLDGERYSQHSYPESRPRERSSAHSSLRSRDLLRLLIDEQEQSNEIRKALYSAFEKLDLETQRKVDAEQKFIKTVEKIRAVNDAKVIAEREAARAKEGLRLYQLQLQEANKEINRAQEVLKVVERQREDAEASAARARTTARQLHEDRAVELAREEGRRLGFEAGVRMGKQMGFADGQQTGYKEARAEARENPDRDGDDEGEAFEEDTAAPLAVPPQDVRALTPPYAATANFQAPALPVPTLTTPVLRAEPDLPLPVPPGDSGRHRRDSTSTSNSAARRDNAQGRSNWPFPEQNPSSGSNSIRSALRHGRQPSISSQRNNTREPPDRDSYVFVERPPPSPLSPSIPLPNLPAHSGDPGYGPPPAQASSVRVRDFAYAPPPPQLHHRRASVDSSSNSSTLSRLELGSPPNSKFRRNLTAIPEVASVRERSMTPEVHGRDRSSVRSRDDARSVASSDRHRDRNSNQRMADSLRYSDPRQPEQWRQDFSSNSHAPRRPSNLTMPAALSPESRRAEYEPVRRTNSLSAPSTQSAGARSSRKEGHRMSSDSSPLNITIEPPSRAGSFTSAYNGNFDFMSPNHRSSPLPSHFNQPRSDRQAPLVPTAPNTERMTPIALPDGKLPPGFVALGPPTPLQGPGMPLSSGSGAPTQPPFRNWDYTSRGPPPSQPASVPYSHMGGIPQPSAPGLSSRSQSNDSGAAAPRQIYSNSPSIPPATIYTRPTTSATSTVPGGMTPSTITQALPADESRILLRKMPSTSSIASGGSYSRYDPTTYNDPAYFPGTQASSSTNAPPGRAPSPVIPPRAPSPAVVLPSPRAPSPVIPPPAVSAPPAVKATKASKKKKR